VARQAMRGGHRWRSRSARPTAPSPGTEQTDTAPCRWLGQRAFPGASLPSAGAPDAAPLEHPAQHRPGGKGAQERRPPHPGSSASSPRSCSSALALQWPPTALGKTETGTIEAQAEERGTHPVLVTGAETTPATATGDHQHGATRLQDKAEGFVCGSGLPLQAPPARTDSNKRLRPQAGAAATSEL